MELKFGMTFLQIVCVCDLFWISPTTFVLPLSIFSIFSSSLGPLCPAVTGLPGRDKRCLKCNAGHCKVERNVMINVICINGVRLLSPPPPPLPLTWQMNSFSCRLSVCLCLPVSYPSVSYVTPPVLPLRVIRSSCVCFPCLCHSQAPFV